MDLRGRPKKRDPYPKSPYGMKHPLHPLNIQKRKEKKNKRKLQQKKKKSMKQHMIQNMLSKL